MPTSFSWTVVPPTPSGPSAAPSLPSTPTTFGAAAYVSLLKGLLPPGVLWNIETDSLLTCLMRGLADEFARIDARSAALIEETDPRTATETISDWEEALSLPDELVIAIPATLAERRVAVTQKLVGLGGQNYAYFDALCEACGYPLISIGKTTMLRVGFRVGDRCYGSGSAYTMVITVSPATAGALSHADFERVIQHATHSHITVQFVYT